MNKLLTAAEAAKKLTCTRANISYLIKVGILKIENGGITTESVDYWSKNRKTGRPLGSYKKN